MVVRMNVHEYIYICVCVCVCEYMYEDEWRCMNICEYHLIQVWGKHRCLWFYSRTFLATSTYLNSTAELRRSDLTSFLQVCIAAALLISRMTKRLTIQQCSTLTKPFDWYESPDQLVGSGKQVGKCIGENAVCNQPDRMSRTAAQTSGTARKDGWLE